MRLRIFIPIITLFTGSTQICAQDVQGTWSGTMKMDQYWEGITGPSEKHVQLTIVNNIVTGTVTGKETLIIGGKTIGTADCQGSGTGELWRVSLNSDGTYDLQGISPKFTCTLSDGTTSEGTLDLLVNSETITNRNALKGSRTDVAEPPGLGKSTITTTWDLTRSVDAQLIIIPDNYDNWLPAPGRDEYTKGSTMKITLQLQGMNGRPLNIKSKGFELKLVNTSKEPGISINYPVVPLADLPDRRFLPLPNMTVAGDMQKMLINCNNCLTANVTLAAFDGGGYTTLTADAILEGDIRIHGSLLVPGGAIEIPVPKRDPGRFIAKKWVDQHSITNDKDDVDFSTGSNNDGDGLSAYEEYRGVVSRGKFKRLDPEHKHVGVWIKRTQYPALAEGIGLFKRATFIDTIVFIENEIGSDRRLNKNALTATVYKQYVLKLEPGSLPDPAVGENRPITVTSKTPSMSDLVIIDVAKIGQKYRDQVRELALYNQRSGTRHTVPYSQTESIANTIAHEMGHGVGLDHHGPESIIRNVIIPANDRSYRVFDSDRNEMTLSQPLPVQGMVGEPGNDSSGDLGCIMAYTSQYQWVRRFDNTINYFAIKMLPVGKIVCTSTDGENINANNQYFGDAPTGYGNCAKDLKLK